MKDRACRKESEIYRDSHTMQWRDSIISFISRKRLPNPFILWEFRMKFNQWLEDAHLSFSLWKGAKRWDKKKCRLAKCKMQFHATRCDNIEQIWGFPHIWADRTNFWTHLCWGEVWLSLYTSSCSLKYRKTNFWLVVIVKFYLSSISVKKLLGERFRPSQKFLTLEYSSFTFTLVDP